MPHIDVARQHISGLRGGDVGCPSRLPASNPLTPLLTKMKLMPMKHHPIVAHEVTDPSDENSSEERRDLFEWLVTGARAVPVGGRLAPF